MRRLCCGSLVAIVGLLVVGCAQQKPAVDPIAAAAQLSTGAPLLRCRADCVAEWRRAQPHAAQLVAAGRWADLAALVISINYQDDLTLYYLGRAAEGLGYPAAAISYYRQSTYISGSALSCQHASGVCGGLVLPDAALARIEALENEAARSRPQPPRRRAPGARPTPAGVKQLPAAERNAQTPVPVDEPLQPGAAEPEPWQPTAPIPLPPDTAPRAPEPNRPTASERSDAGGEPPPPAQPASPQPTRVDPIAKQFIEPPAGR
jgi:hypothetical protein